MAAVCPARAELELEEVLETRRAVSNSHTDQYPQDLT